LQYRGVTLSTPQKSSAIPPPLATIGGEPAGRGAIVVQDNVGQAPDVPPKAEETAVDAGKAEPGRDIFAQQPQPEVMSKEKAVEAPAENDEPKAISSVGLPSGDGPSEILADKPLNDALSGAVMGNTAAAEKLKVQGPPEAEQAEADEVRQELFPEAHVPREN
jgi:dolichyl-phosphate-mannose-protein mannosyltransferase